MNTPPEPFHAFRIHADRDNYRAGVEEMRTDDLTPGEVLGKVAYSSVNYKDALAGTGKGKILREPTLVGGPECGHGHVATSSFSTVPLFGLRKNT